MKRLGLQRQRNASSRLERDFDHAQGLRRTVVVLGMQSRLKSAHDRPMNLL
ncbi:MAG: hypothetical protein ACOVQT_16440 [Rubrivivax sp.]